MDGGQGIVVVLVRLYRMLLFVYPLSFRSEYEREMVQVFRTACSECGRRDPRSLAGFVLDALRDLAVSGPAERLALVRERQGLGQIYVYTVALALSVLTGYIRLHSDADRFTMLLVFGAAGACAVARPHRAWRYGVILGLGISVAVFAGYVGVMPVSGGDKDFPLPLSVVPGLIGAQVGVLINRFASGYGISERLRGSRSD